MRKVTVIGARGFIGSNVVEALRSACDVNTISIRLQPKDLRLEVSSAGIDSSLTGYKRRVLDFYHDDVSSLAAQLTGSDVVLNCAGEPDASLSDTMVLFPPNAYLPAVIAEACNLAGVPRFIHISSAVVQGRRDMLDSTANFDPFSPYARSKSLGEQLVLQTRDEGTVVYRPPSVHAASRRITRTLVRLAYSPFSSVACPADTPSPQAHIDNVASAIAYLALTPKTPPPIVHHPWEGLTTSSLLTILGGRPPVCLPESLAKMLIGALSRVPHRVSEANLRRLEMVWFGQPQAPSWLSTEGWNPATTQLSWYRFAVEATRPNEESKTEGNAPASTRRVRSKGLRIGLVTSIGPTLDAFFPEIAQHWINKGNSVFYAAGTASSQLPSTVLPSITRTPNPRNFASGSQIAHWARRERLDVIITNTATASSLVRSTLGLPPVLYFCHGLHWPSPPNWRDVGWMSIERALLTRTRGVICLNTPDYAWFSQRIAGDALLYLPFGVGLDLEKYPRTPLPPLRGKHELCWIGEFTSRKRPELAVYTARELLSRGVDFHLTMLGIGQLHERTIQLAESLKLSDRISFPGWGNASEVLAQSHAIIHTAAWEGLPRVLLEALAVGRPIYSFATKGSSDIPGAFLAPDADPAGLAELILANSPIEGRLADCRESLDYRCAADAIEQFIRQIA